MRIILHTGIFSDYFANLLLVMTRLLILFFIFIGIIFIFKYFIKRFVKKYFSSSNNYENKSQNINENKKGKIIYERDDVVVMKGDAPEDTKG